jgi:hypothetical protein
MENPFLHFSCGRRRQWSIILVALLVSSGLFTGSAGAEERTYPIKIGELTASWGPTPTVVGLCKGGGGGISVVAWMKRSGIRDAGGSCSPDCIRVMKLRKRRFP